MQIPERSLRIALLLTCFLAPASQLGAQASAGQTLYVKTPGTELRASGSGTSAVKARLKIGAVLTVVSASGRWLAVTSEQGEGYVFAAKTDKRPPDTGDPLWDALTTESDDVCTVEGSTALGLRGLSKTAQEHAGRAKDVSPVHVKQLKSLEKIQVKDSELKKFLRNGRLGEYAK